MSELTGKSIATTYQSLLNITGDTGGLAVGGYAAVQVKTGSDAVTPLYLNTNRIGIGTNSPDYALDVSGAGVLGQIRVHSTDADGTIRIDTEDEDHSSILSFESGLQSQGTIWYDHHATDTSQAMNFTTGDNNTLAMTIKGSGNVGIGTATPSTRLEVKCDTSHFGISLIENSGAESWQIGIDADGDLNFHNSSGATPQLAITDAGEMGMGTTAPSSSLHISKGDSDVSRIILSTYHDTDGNQSSLDFMKSKFTTAVGNHTAVVDGESLGTIRWYGSDGTNFEEAATIRVRVDGTPNNSPPDADMPARIEFATTPDGTDSAVERMTIDSAGKVGIGTTSPTANLHIDGIADLAAHASDETVLPGVRFELTGGAQSLDFGVSTDGTDYWWMQSRSKDDYAIHKNLVLQPTGGNVGIGENAPDDKLHVKEATSGQYTMKIEHTHASNANGINILYAGTGYGSGTDHAIYFEDGDGGHFQVSGDGDVTNADNSYGSDIRIKKDVVDATSKLDDLLNLKVRNYKYKKSDGSDVAGKLGEKRIGFVADEFETVFPNLVTQRKEKKFGTEYDDLKSIRWSALVPILVKAVQELSAKVTALENA